MMKRRGFALALLTLGASGRLVSRSQSQNTIAPPLRQTGLLWDEVYLRHLAGDTGHPERPERLTAIRTGLEQAGLLSALTRVAVRRVTDDELALAHDRRYIELTRRELSNVSGLKDLSTGDTLVSHDSFDTARAAAGGVLNAADAVVAGRLRNAFCAVRPPGHHATQNRGMGFCIYNNVAVAARYLQRVHGVARVLIVDWDYHHGNGTQDIFYEDDSVFYFSTHHYGAYPGSGSASETGRGRGAGTTLNVPLPPGAGDADILRAFEDRLVPAARAFKPNFVLISAGFDGMRRDVLGRFDVTPQGFAAITRVVVDIASQLCEGRLVSVLEGGYRLDGLADSVTAHVTALRAL